MNPASSQVLVVDDDASFAGMIAEALGDRGYAVARARSGGEALELARKTSFSVALLDIVMPGMDGLQLSKRLTELTPDLEVILLTGHPDVDTAIGGIQHRVFDYIRKSEVDLARLERSVGDAASRSQLRRENRELVARLAESNRRLKVLHDMAQALAGQEHLDRVLERLVDSARELTRAEAARALLLEPTASEGRLVRLVAGDGDTLPGMRLAPGESLATLAVESGEAVLLEDPRRHPRFSARCDALPAEGPGFVAAPLGGGAAGALLVAGRDGGFEQEDRELVATLAREGGLAIGNALARERSVNFFTHTCEILLSVLETLDVFYPGHSRAVAALSDLVTRRLGMTEEERRAVHFAALLHDIGKIRVERGVLGKAGKISEEDWAAMREHPALGLELLKPIMLWEDVLPIIHAHHERWDGKGYPRGLAGEAIPLGARVVALADAFDAMTRDTPHRARRSAEAALAELEAFAGSQFDPRLVRLFVAEYRERGDQIR